VNHSYDAVTSL